MAKHTLKLPDGLFEYLSTVAAEAGQSPEELILKAIEQHLEDLSDLRAIAAYEQQKADGTLETIPFEDVKRRLGVDH